VINVTIYHFLPTVFAFSFGVAGGYIGLIMARSNRRFQSERIVGGLVFSFCISVMLSWAFSDHLLSESTWFLYARRDGLAAGVICYFMMKHIKIR
jgi:hypothetical protein